jgi:LysR family positive regulator for ilvC
MDIKTLQMFQHLAQSLHFGKTASAYFVSPSTLSRQLQRLEQQLDCVLFERDNRRVTLTAAGQAFLAYTNQQLAAWHELKTVIHSQQTQLTGKLHLYCSVTAAYSHLPLLLDKFRQLYPQVEIMLTTGDASDAVDHVMHQSVDIAIAAYPEPLAKQLYFQEIAQIPLVFIAPAFSCKVQQQVLQTEVDWSQVPFILPEQGAVRKRFDRWYKQKSLQKPQIYATVSGHEALVSMVALGCGVGLAPQIVIDTSPVKDRVQTLRHVGTVAPFALGLCCLNKSTQSPLVKAFIDAAQR